MSRFLKTAAVVVGAVALVATGVGALGGGAALAGALGTTTATIASVAKIASLGAALLSVGAQLTAKKPSAQATGSQTSFAADPDAGIPLVIGRTGTSGNIVFRAGFDTKDAGDNDRQSFVSVLSLGPVKSVGGMKVDKSPVNFGGTGAAIGAFAGFMWCMTQIGALPEANAMSFGAGAGTPPGWTASHKLSGKAAASWTLRFDTKSKLYQNGVPEPMWVVEGGLCYDPRKDSTYPGGAGSHRMADPADRAAYDAAVATWEYTENPFLHGLKFVHGCWQRDRNNPASDWQRVMGMGAPLAGIDVASFVEGANIADANGWKVGGVIYSGDDKWDSLKKILQAGMGEPLALGAKVACFVNAPRVSLATISIDDVVGEATVAATQPRRSRINTITPRYRLEANHWELLPGAPISVPAHVAEDRGKRSKVQDYPFIQDSKQVATAVRYDIENAREFGPITLPLKLVWMGYKPGDCVTANLPELGLNGQPILLLNRDLEPSGGIVTMTARSETVGKHPFALGQTTTPPPTPGVTGPMLIPVPGETAWAISGTEIVSDGSTVPALIVTGAVDMGSAEAIVLEYRPFVDGQGVDAGWLGAGIFEPNLTRHVITGVRAGASYEVGISYQRKGFTGARRIIGPVTTSGVAVDFEVVTGPTKPADNATNSADPNSPLGPNGTVGSFLTALAAADARQDVLENEIIPSINDAVADAGERITAARAVANQALTDASEVNQRVDTLIAEGGGGSEGVDTVARAEISRVETAAIGRDNSIGQRIDTVQADFGEDLNAKAQEITTAFTNADLALAGRTTTLEASARADVTMLNRNATFSDWPDGQPIPSGYDDASGNTTVNGTTTRVAGKVGRYAMRQVYDAFRGGVQTFVGVAGAPGFGDASGVDPRLAMGGGWYVLEGDVELELGQLFGSGLYIAGYNSDGVYLGEGRLDFAREPDSSGQVNGAGTPGKRYRYSKLVELPAGTAVLRFHPLTAEQVFGAPVYPYKILIWHAAGVRPADQADLKADQAVSTLIPAVAARIKSTEDTLADLPNRYAAAQRVDTLEAQVSGTSDSGLRSAINSRIEDRATAIADAKAGAVAQTVSTLRAEYNDTAAEVVDQRGVITDLQGKSAAYVKIVADAGNGRAAISLWSDEFGGNWELVGNGVIRGDLLVDGAVTLRNLDRSTMTAVSQAVSSTPYPIWESGPNGGQYSPGLVGSILVRAGGTLYANLDGLSSGTNVNGNTANRKTFELFNSAGAVIASVPIPDGAINTQQLNNYLIRISNTFGEDTLTWRIRNWGQGSFFNGSVTVNWVAL